MWDSTRTPGVSCAVVGSVRVRIHLPVGWDSGFKVGQERSVSGSEGHSSCGVAECGRE